MGGDMMGLEELAVYLQRVRVQLHSLQLRGLADPEQLKQ